MTRPWNKLAREFELFHERRRGRAAGRRRVGLARGERVEKRERVWMDGERKGTFRGVRAGKTLGTTVEKKEREGRSR